jgi:TolB-like protein
MKTLSLALLLLVGTSASAAERRPRLAVLGVTPLNPDSKKVAEIFSALIAAELVRTPRFEVIAAEELATRLGAEVKTLERCADKGCSEAAKRAGADFVLVGSAVRIGREIGIELKSLDPADGKVLASDASIVSGQDELLKGARSSLEKILRPLPTTIQVAEDRPVVAAVTPPAPTGAVTSVAAPAPAERTTPGVAIGLLGGGAVAIAAGAVLSAGALSFNQEKSTLAFDDAKVARDAAQARLVGGYAVAGAGLAAALVGTYVLLAQPGEDDAAVALAPAPGGAALTMSGRF